MADNDNQDTGAAGAGGQPGADGQTAQQGPQAAILAQYVKDLSFENPRSPQTLQQLAQGQVKPQMQVNVNVGARKVGDEAFEVELKISAESKMEEETAFQVELVYAGLFGARNLPDTVVEPFLLVQAPSVLFPFARRIVADAVRDGGYPPLMLEPIDFARLYQQQRQQPGVESSGSEQIGAIDLNTPPSGNA